MALALRSQFEWVHRPVWDPGDRDTHSRRADLHAVVQDVFGYTTFRDGQERVIRTLLEGRDALAILPTGGGKSLLYQLTSHLLRARSGCLYGRRDPGDCRN